MTSATSVPVRSRLPSVSRQYQIVAIVLVPALISLGLLLVLLRSTLNDGAIERWTHDHLAFVSTLGDRIDGDILHASELIRLASRSPHFAALPERARIDLSIWGLPEGLEPGKRHVLEHLRVHGGFSVLFVLTPDGDQYITHPFEVQRSLRRYNLADRPYFRKAVETGALVVSNGFVGSDGVPAIAIDIPVHDADGEIVLHLGGVLHLTKLSALLTPSNIAPFDRAMLIDSSGWIIADSDSHRLPENALGTLPSARSGADDEITRTYHDTVRLSRWNDPDGIRWVDFETVLDTGWRLVLLRDEALLLGEIAPQVRHATLLAAAALLLPTLIGLALALHFSRRWQRADEELRHANATLEQRVTERTAELARSEARLHLTASVFTHAREGIVITDAAANIVEVNDSFSRVTGYSRDEVLGHNPRILKSGRQSPEFYVAMWHALTRKGHWYGEIWNRRKNGEEYAEMLTVSAIRDSGGVTRNYVALFTDITEIKRHQQQLEHIAHYDMLTGLPNRVLFADRLHQALAHVERSDKSLAVLYLDLDGFKSLNDRHGHNVGDALLVELAQRIRNALRAEDTLARVGGDEFVAVLIDLDAPGDCDPVIKRILDAAAEQVTIHGTMLQLSASIGLTIYPHDRVAPDQLLRHADQAMYLAKQAGRNRCHRFDVEHDEEVRGRRERVEAISRGLSRGEFVLHYQPKVNMRSGEVVGAEALVRWQHPERGLLSPANFLPLLADELLGEQLDEWVIRTALAQMAQWKRQGLIIRISVNVGGRQLQRPGFPARLQSLLSAHPDLDPGQFEIEVLETTALEDMAHVSDTLHACRTIGVHFALDDFGTGYSSLTYLKRLPVQTLKIDQSFVRDMPGHAEDHAIIQGILGLASAFGQTVIAEGVETAAHGEHLLAMNCELAQGYAIARPMPAPDLPDWIATWRPCPTWSASHAGDGTPA